MSQPSTGREAARVFGAYAKNFAAGAFATPTAADLDKAMSLGNWNWWEPGIAAVENTLARGSVRTDFTGRKYQLAPGSRIITHLAAPPDAPLPLLDDYDAVFAYVEDRNITDQLLFQARRVRAIRISASSEIVACWGRSGDGYNYSAADIATLVQIPLPMTDGQRRVITDEVASVDNWCDDYPYYSDGSWDAVSLRGFNPADPMWGVKPAEMSKSWRAAHPDAALLNTCEWTVLADRCPATVELVKSVAWWGQLERVRLMRMAARGGKGGSLSRHTDITDRAAGTRDGQIVRFHIPVVTHPNVTMTAWDLDGVPRQQHLAPWSMWYLDARKPHAVHNRAGVDRIHLVVDVVANAAVRREIALAGVADVIRRAATPTRVEYALTGQAP